jgi:nucleoside-triphosphatase THEP1
MNENKIFVKTSENEALAIGRIIRWSWGERKLIIVHEGGTIEVTNPAYVEQLHKILLAKTDTLISRKKPRLPNQPSAK